MSHFQNTQCCSSHLYRFTFTVSPLIKKKSRDGNKHLPYLHPSAIIVCLFPAPSSFPPIIDSFSSVISHPSVPHVIHFSLYLVDNALYCIVSCFISLLMYTVCNVMECGTNSLSPPSTLYSLLLCIPPSSSVLPCSVNLSKTCCNSFVSLTS